MTTLQNIGNKLYAKEYIYTPTFISKLNNIEKQKLRENTNNEINFLLLVIYLLIISFVIVMLILISQGDKHNPYPDDKKFRGDIKNKELTFWDKIYYIIFGKHIVPKYKSSCNHLTCEKDNNAPSSKYNDDNIKQSNNDKYNYLSVFNNISNSFNNTINNDDDLDIQFNNSRKCLLGNNYSNNNSNNKYSYLGISMVNDNLD